MKIHLRIILAFALVFSVTSLVAHVFAQGSCVEPESQRVEDRLQPDCSLRIQFWDIPRNARTEDGMARVIVEMMVPDIDILSRASASTAMPRAADSALTSAIQTAAAGILSSLPESTHTILRQYRFVPMISLEVSADGLEQLQADPRVKAVYADLPFPLPEYKIETEREISDINHPDVAEQPLLTDTIALIGADKAWEGGYTGSGWHVAVLDTGIRRTHEFFHGKDIVEACFSQKSHCPNGQRSMSGPGAAAHYSSTYNGYDHGTHVAGIAVGNKPDGTMHGVAKDANLIAVNVFSKFSAADCGGGRPCVMSYTSDTLAGLEYVYGLRSTYDIGAVNMSLGGGRHSSYCNNDSRKVAIDILLAANIPTVIATGNSRWCGSVSAPACISTAISVMASSKSDNESSFNNWHSAIGDLFAPGQSIRSATGYSDTSYQYWSGTSMATPHVAGAFGIMMNYNPSDPAELHLSRITEFGPSITSKCTTEESKPRLYVDIFSTDMPMISGRVTRGDTGGGLSGVTITCSDNGGTATTDGNGNYSRSVPHGWGGACTPTYAAPGTFSPALHTYSNVTSNQTNQNYSWTPTPGNLGTCLDNTSLIWTTGGNGNWYCQSSVSHHDGSAAQSGSITHNQRSWLQTTVTGPGTLHFHWRVSSEANRDFLSFSIGNSRLDRISGDVDWQKKTYAVPAGTHTLEWVYSKDSSVNDGMDAGWVDHVRWTASKSHALTVKSANTSGVRISANPSVYGGSTNYTKTDILNGTQITLTAPAASNGAVFDTWSGCDEASDAARTCRITMTTDKSVTVRYSTGPAGSALYFPHIATDGPWMSEIGIINSGQTQLSGALRGFTETGQEVYSEPVTLPVYGRMEQNVTRTDINYMRLDITSGMAVGFQKFSDPGRYRVGLEAVARPLEGPLYVPHIASTDTWWTGIAAVNTGNATKNLQFIFEDGQQETKSLGAGQHKPFQFAPQPGLGSARVDDAAGLVGLQLFGTHGPDFMLSGISFGNETARRLVFPHLHSDEVWWTGYGVYNTTPNVAQLNINIYSEKGAFLYQENAMVQGHSKRVSPFGEGQLPEGSAWFTIEATQPVIGFQLFGNFRTNQMGGYSVVNLGTREGVFPNIDQNGWTGIAFVNSSGQPTTVRLDALTNDGRVVAEQYMQLAAGEKKLGIAHEFFNAPIDGATWIAFTAAREIVGFQLNGSSDNVMLDALPALGANFTSHNPFNFEEKDGPENDGQ